MRSDKSNISQESLERLLIQLMNCTDEDGLLLNINPANAFQDWLLHMYPKELQEIWFNMHSYVRGAK
jgi:hypothetical protein